MDQIKQYLKRIGVWVDGGYVNVHHIYRVNGKVIFPGSACATLIDAVREVNYWNGKKTDIYLAMNAYKEHGGTEKTWGKPKAIRQAYNVIACKCLYMDVDVDTDDLTKYQTTEEMDAGIANFYQYTNMPHANIVVNSGRGGKHLYWILDSMVHPSDWIPLARALANAGKASGLKFDPQCTVDITRLLRVPGTFNFKRDPPPPVDMAEDDNGENDPQDLVNTLAQWWQELTSTSQTPVVEDEDDDHDDLGAGISGNFQPVDINLIAKECPFIADTLATHGKGLPEPLWKHTISIACHTTDPEENVHLLSSGHVSYSPSETYEKLTQAKLDRQRRATLGPPKCEAINDSGAVQCKACKHLANNPTPVSFGRINGHSYASIPGTSDLPKGYYRNPNDSDHIYYQKQKDGTTEEVCVFPFKILPSSAYIESSAPYQFTFTTIEAGHEKVIKVNQNAMSSRERAPMELGAQGLSVNYKEPVKDFFVAYLQQMHRHSSTLIHIPPVGWYNDGGANGFAFAGEFYTPGKIQKCRLLPVEASNYGVLGLANPWIDLAKIVVTPARPDLCILVAAGFAAPMVAISGQLGFLLGAWSTPSGVGKSTALTLAQSIWGNPVEKNGLTDTENHMFAKAATIKHLPLIFDEIKNTRQQGTFVSMIFQISAGKEKGRANRDGGMKVTRNFETPLIYATNASMCSAVEEHTKGSYATLYRMMEFECLKNTPLQYSPSDIARMTTTLSANYGAVGRMYAKYLGENYEYAVKCMKFMQTKLEKELFALQEERFWIAAIATTIVGAYLAKKAGLANFPLAIMEKFLKDEFLRQREGKLLSPVDYGNVQTVISELGLFLKDHRTKCTIVTDTMIMTAGRPQKGANAIKVLNEDVGIRKDAIFVHIGIHPTLMLRFSDAALGRWCKLRQVPKANLVEALRSKLSAKYGSARIASGTQYADVTEPCWTISVVGTDLEKEVEWTRQYK